MAYEGYYDQGASLYGTNPAAATLYRKRKMAEMLSQQGTDSSPAATPLVGLSRLAQALLGAYGTYSADKEAGELQKKSDTDFAAASAKTAEMMNPPTSNPLLPPGAPPPSPMAQQLMGQPTQQQLPPAELMPMYQAAAQKYDIPVETLIAQHRQESGFNPNATGAAGEIGLGQIKPSTAQAPGFGVAPVDPATLRDPAKNIDFSAAYLKGRGDAVGVKDWSDPAQRALALKAYNGGGDPNYVANVDRYMPRPGGGAQNQFAGPGAPPPSGALPSMPQGQAAPAPTADPRIAQSQQLMQWGIRASQHPDPRIQAQGKIALQQADQLERQVEAQRVREDARNNRVPHTVTLGDQDGKGSSVWILGPDGQPKQRVGAAPKAERAPQTVTVGGPDGSKIHVLNPDGSLGPMIGDAPKQPGDKNLDPRTVIADLGPKVRGGTATQQELDRYNVAASDYVQPRTITNEHGTFQITPQLPPGMPAPKAAGPAAVEAPAQPQGNLPPGVQQYKNTERDPPQAVATGLLANAGNLKNIDKAIDALKAYPQAIGPGNYARPGPMKNWLDSAGVDARARIADLSSMILHDRAGTAMTAQELARVRPFIPEDTDTYEVAMTKLGKLREQVHSLVTDTYGAYGPSSGYRKLDAVEEAVKPREAPVQANATHEEMRAELQRRGLIK